LILKNKNWPNDSRIDYKTPSSLVELIEMHMELMKELKEFERYNCEHVIDSFFIKKNYVHL
jgi:hypothetical protein